jgi:hypothetical protein
MKIGPAVAAMHAAFADEGLTNLQPVQSASNRSPNVDVVRLSFGQSASEVSPDYRSDRFRLLLAGPADDLRVTGVSRDYLAPTGLDRATVLRNLIHRYGPPSSSIVPDAAVAPDTAQLEWLIRPNGARGGDGSQGSESLQCNAGMSSYEDYFAHAASGEEAQLLALLQQQQKAGCGLVLLIGFGGNVVHYALYDTGAAMAALRQGQGLCPQQCQSKAVALPPHTSILSSFLTTISRRSPSRSSRLSPARLGMPCQSYVRSRSGSNWLSINISLRAR